MLKFLSSQAQLRFKELQEKLARFSISNEEQLELADLVAKAQKVFQERDSVIARLKAEIAENVLTVTDLFSAAEIRAAGRQTPGKTDKAAPAVRKAKNSSRAGIPVLIHAKVGKGAGAPSKYYKGQKLPPVVPRNFKALDEGGALSANLARYYTPEGKLYFATPEGRAELETLENYIRNGKAVRQ
jgi:hypothetical protein